MDGKPVEQTKIGGEEPEVLEEGERASNLSKKRRMSSSRHPTPDTSQPIIDLTSDDVDDEPMIIVEEDGGTTEEYIEEQSGVPVLPEECRGNCSCTIIDGPRIAEARRLMDEVIEEFYEYYADLQQAQTYTSPAYSDKNQSTCNKDIDIENNGNSLTENMKSEGGPPSTMRIDHQWLKDTIIAASQILGKFDQYIKMTQSEIVGTDNAAVNEENREAVSLPSLLPAIDTSDEDVDQIPIQTYKSPAYSDKNQSTCNNDIDIENNGNSLTENMKSEGGPPSTMRLEEYKKRVLLIIANRIKRKFDQYKKNIQSEIVSTDNAAVNEENREAVSLPSLLPAIDTSDEDVDQIPIGNILEPCVNEMNNGVDNCDSEEDIYNTAQLHPEVVDILTVRRILLKLHCKSIKKVFTCSAKTGKIIKELYIFDCSSDTSLQKTKEENTMEDETAIGKPKSESDDVFPSTSSDN